MEKKDFKRYLITCALPYANGPLHIGHLAGVYVPADIYVRFLRMKGRDVKFICGSDEHGVPITIRAKKEGCSPQEVVDKYHAMIRDAFAAFGMSFDIYHRTSSKTHHETSAAFFKKLHDEGKFIELENEQYFDPEAQEFLADRYITGDCPKCGAPGAYGDQCEKCGSSLNATDLINPKSALSGAEPVLRKTKHWFLPLDQYQPFLEKWILEGHREWKTNVYGQCKSWLDAGLQPRAVSRDLSWGVPVPLPGAEGKVLYVWFDAPIGYISATRDLTPDWETYWKDQGTKMVHFIGKDNIVFHCIVFPAMLKAHGDYILPENVPANEFLNLESDKLSTSKNWAVWLHEYLEDFPGKQDVLRYVLAANMPEAKDNDFTWKDFQTRNNSELVGILGNFVNRVLGLTKSYYDGQVPSPSELQPIDREALAQIGELRGLMEKNLETYHFREALKDYIQLARLGNKYLTDTEPWKIKKTDPERVRTVLYVSLQLTAALSLLGEPFLPNSAARMRGMLQLELRPWDEVAGELIAPGYRVEDPVLLFEKIEDEAIARQLAKLSTGDEAQHEGVEEKAAPGEVLQTAKREVKPQKPLISFDQFDAVDLRVAKVLEAERVPKTDKLIKMKLDTGVDIRTVVSGIAASYSPEDMVGRQVVIVLNLAPRKMRGIESSGMLLFAQKPDGSFTNVAPEDEALPGTPVA
ncbi:MAG: methionine--tRNA ligase [Bacteroidia bacterium]|nr:MAG: methionine--tRNA ligase [Bacteroidia bacterium]